MDVVVDGLIYQRQASGGISRIFDEILPRMCDIDPSVNIELLTSGRLLRELPVHPNIHRHSIFPIDRLVRPDRLWWPVAPALRAFVQQAAVGRSRGRIWQSTYYTVPKSWDGPSVVLVPDMIYERFSDLFTGARNDQIRRQRQRAIDAADVVICISKTTRNDVQQEYRVDGARTRVIPLAHGDVFRLLKDPGLEIGLPTCRPFLLYVGGRFLYKNFSALLSAYSIWASREEVDLVVVGGKWSTEEVRQITMLRIAEHVHLLEHVDDQFLCSLYNRAVALVYPSLYEGFGIPLVEAMACGCPIVASHIPSTIEVAGSCPIYFETTEIDSLRVGLDIAQNEGRHSDRVRGGFRRIRDYSWGQTAIKTLMTYREVDQGF